MMSELSKLSYVPQTNTWIAWKGEIPVGQAEASDKAMALLKTS